MFKCENHPNRQAEWFRDSFLPSANAVPICYECKSNYILLNLDKALHIRPVFGGQQGKGQMKFILYQTKDEFGVKSVEFCCYPFFRQLNINFELQISNLSGYGLNYIINQGQCTAITMKINDKETVPITNCPFCGAKIEIKWIQDDRLKQS